MSDDAALETGWSASTPPGDSIESDFLRCWAERIRSFARAGAAPLVDDDGVTLAVLSTRTFWGNLGVVRRPDQDPQELARRLAAALPPGAPVALFSPWPLLDLGAIGFQSQGFPPLMVRPPGAGAVEVPDGITVTEATDPAALAEWEQTLIEAYPTPGADVEPPLTLFPAGVLGSSTRFWTAHRGGRAVATAASHVGHGVVDVEFVATRDEERGRGVGAAVTWAATAADTSLPAVLVASDPGRSVYERLGYLTTRRWRFWAGAVGPGGA